MRRITRHSLIIAIAGACILSCSGPRQSIYRDLRHWFEGNEENHFAYFNQETKWSTNFHPFSKLNSINPIVIIFIKISNYILIFNCYIAFVYIQVQMQK